MLKVYQCDDSDLYAAESSEQAASLYEDMTGEKPVTAQERDRAPRTSA